MAPDRPEVVVVGGGPVGMVAALALCDVANIRIVDGAALPGSLVLAGPLDHRVYALSPASKTLLESLGAWHVMAPERTETVRAMQIWGDDRVSHLDFSMRLPLASIVEHSALLAALAKRVALAGIEVIAPAKPSAISLGNAEDTRSSLKLDNGRTLFADLIVAADGAQSWTRQSAGLAVQEISYASEGVVANFACERPHLGTARQWFAKDSVLAWLPLPNQQMSMVWSVAGDRSKALSAMSPGELADAVRLAGDASLGDLTLVSPVARFPLRRILASECVAPGLVLIGDAAHTIHPLAGQGVNLGLGDVAALAHMLQTRGPLQRPGSLALLRKFARVRREQVLALATLTDQLNGIYAKPQPGISRLRNSGLSWLNHQGPVKRAMMRYAMR